MLIEKQDGSTCEVILPYKKGSAILGRDKDREYLVHMLGNYDSPARTAEVYRALISCDWSKAFKMPVS